MMNHIKNSLIFRLKRYFKHHGRRNRIKATPASKLDIGEIDSLEMLEICKNSGQAIETIYDIGAHVGVWTLLAKSVFPKSKVACFEPLNRHLHLLQANIAQLEDVNIYPTALGSENAELSINVANRSDSSSIMELTDQQSKIFGVFKDSVETIQMTKLDEFVRRHNMPLPNLMKLDIQGYELEALKGGLKCLKTCSFVILEVSFLEFYKGQPLFEEVIAFMASQQYKTISFGYNTDLGGRIEQCDILFENKAF